MSDDLLRQSTARLHHAKGAMLYSLELFGDELAKRQKYKEHTGLDAVRYFLMCKHGWLPRDVCSMSEDDLTFAMAEEKSGWIMPKGAGGYYPGM
jgi:hypothetical protein